MEITATLIKDLREAIAQEDEGRMQSLSQELQQVMMQIGQSSYSEPQEQARGDGGQSGNDEGVVEGEYTVE